MDSFIDLYLRVSLRAGAKLLLTPFLGTCEVIEHTIDENEPTPEARKG